MYKGSTVPANPRRGDGLSAMADQHSRNARGLARAGTWYSAPSDSAETSYGRRSCTTSRSVEIRDLQGDPGVKTRIRCAGAEYAMARLDLCTKYALPAQHVQYLDTSFVAIVGGRQVGSG